jgi:hypothetical protein
LTIPGPFKLAALEAISHFINNDIFRGAENQQATVAGIVDAVIKYSSNKFMS